MNTTDNTHTSTTQPSRTTSFDPRERAAIDARLRRAADQQQQNERQRTDSWSHGFTRRRVLAGGLGFGVAGIASQLVTTRVALAAEPATNAGTLVVVFLRGGMDGLSMLVPAEDPQYLAARPDVAIRGGQLIQLDRGFGLHPGMSALASMVKNGQVAAVPGISTPNITRSHFQAQACLESGGAAANQGWLDRLLDVIGPGTTYRALSAGNQVPQSLLGSSPLGMSSLPDFQIYGYDGLRDSTRTALQQLYTGIDNGLSTAALNALTVEATMTQLSGTEPTAVARGYSDDDWGHALASIGSLVRNGYGVRVATVDLGGWDMHTSMGTATNGDFHDMTVALSSGLANFFKDIGDQASSTTVVVMSEFGRRVAQNASGGTDHGHGGACLVLGDGVAGGVKGTWAGLSSSLNSEGDVIGANDYRDVLSEVIMRRFGLSAGQASTVFPSWSPSKVGVMS